jgi:hypothetical protein
MTYAKSRREAQSAYLTPFPFMPKGGVTLACTTTTARATLPTDGGETAVITNYGSATAFLTFGTSTVTSVIASSMLAILPLTQATFTIPETSTDTPAIDTLATHIAGITAAGSTDIHIAIGYGI